MALGGSWRLGGVSAGRLTNSVSTTRLFMRRKFPSHKPISQSLVAEDETFSRVDQVGGQAPAINEAHRVSKAKVKASVTMSDP